MTEEQFTGYVERYRQNLIEHAYSLLKDWDDAEDAVQEGLLRLYNRRHAYDPERAAVYSWMATAVLNRAKTILERRKHKLEREQGLDPDNDESVLSGCDDQSFIIDVGVAINNLPLDIKVAIVLHYIQGYTVEEVAKACKVTIRTIGRRLAKGRKLLRLSLMEYDLDLEHQKGVTQDV